MAHIAYIPTASVGEPAPEDRAIRSLVGNDPADHGPQASSGATPSRSTATATSTSATPTTRGPARTKDESLLLKRSPDGRVAELAGSTAGHRDGDGRQAQFRGINGLAWGPDGLLYISDHDSIRKVTRDGVVTTLARGLVERKSASGRSRGADHLFGLAVAAGGSVFVADNGSRRILKISPRAG